MFYEIHTNDEIYWPAPSGVRIVAGEKAVGFHQYNNPGPYVAVLNEAVTNQAIPTVANFRKQIREGIHRVGGWRLILEQKPANNNIPELLQILRQRPSGEAYYYFERDRDFFVDKVCQTLADLHDSDALLEAARVVGPRWDLSAGFGTSTGREFLRQHIADDRETVERRVLCADLLGNAGNGDAPEWHFKQMAELAARPNQIQKVQVALVQSMRSIARRCDSMERGTEVQSTNSADWKQAGAILVQLAQKTGYEELKYHIDLALPEMGFSPLSPNNCLLQFDRYDVSTRKLHMKCYISGRSGMAPMPLAFVDVKTGQKWTALSNLYFHGDETDSPADVVVPKDLPHGRYKVYYEFMENGNIKSTSHYFEVDL